MPMYYPRTTALLPGPTSVELRHTAAGIVALVSSGELVRLFLVSASALATLPSDDDPIGLTMEAAQALAGARGRHGAVEGHIGPLKFGTFGPGTAGHDTLGYALLGRHQGHGPLDAAAVCRRTGQAMESSPIVLVVDGHVSVCRALAERLRRAPGIGAVLTAGTLHTALVLVRAHAPHIVICDPRTLDGDFLTTVRCLRREATHVLVQVATLGEYERAALLGAGAAAVLLKGDTEGLLGTIATLVAQ